MIHEHLQNNTRQSRHEIPNSTVHNGYSLRYTYTLIYYAIDRPYHYSHMNESLNLHNILKTYDYGRMSKNTNCYMCVSEYISP